MERKTPKTFEDKVADLLQSRGKKVDNKEQARIVDLVRAEMSAGAPNVDSALTYVLNNASQEVAQARRITTFAPG